jgi:hypothetical protein
VSSLVGCIAGLNIPSTGTLLEEQDKELPSGDVAWLHRLDQSYKASQSNPAKQVELIYEAEGVRYKACGWYSDETSMYTLTCFSTTRF